MSAAEAYAAEGPAVAAPGENPFKFLEYYEENDAAIFAGRSEELATVLAEFALGATYVLYGRSGLGKTSIIKAGLFPRLREIGYLPIYVRILDNPELELCREVQRVLELKQTPAPDQLPRLLANVPSSDPHGTDDITVTPVILVLDQFEEFFIRFRNDPALRKRLTELLGAISREGGAAVRIVFSLREDYIAELNDLKPQLPDILVRSHRLLPLTAVGAREAILVTLRHHQVAFEDAVPTALVKELEQHRFSPLVLQIYCSEVYKEAKRRNPGSIYLTVKDVEKVGSVKAVYESYLEAVTAGLESDRVLLACCMLDILRTAEQTKRALRIRDVAIDATSDTPLPVTFNVTCSEAESMLNHLREKSVVRRLPTEEPWYELLHDGIVPVLTEWLQAKREFRNFRDADRLVDNLHAMEGTYLNAKQLRQAVDPYQRLLRLAPAEIAFLFRSSVYEQGTEVASWARRFDEIEGEGASARVIREAIESVDHTVSGVVAAGRMRSTELAPHCLAKAIQDPRPAVRRAAGTAYAEIGALDFDAIKSALRRPGTRRNAIDLLADLQMREHALTPINRFTRWRAQRVVDRRQLSEGAELIRNRMILGVLGGIVGAVLLLVFAIAPAVYVVSALLNPGTSPLGAMSIVVLLEVIPLVIFGSWIGRRAVARAAQEAVRSKTEAWSRRAAMAWEIEVVLFFVTAYAASRNSIPESDQSVVLWLVHAVPALALLVYAIRLVFRVWRAHRAQDMPERNALVLRWSVTAPVLAAYVGFLVIGARSLSIALAAMVLSWMLLGPSLRLVQRAVNPAEASLPQIAFRATQLAWVTGILPLLVLLLIKDLPLQGLAKSIVSDAALLGILASLLLALRASITAFSLAWAEKAYPLSGEGFQVREARTISGGAQALLTWGMLLPFILAPAIFGSHFLPFGADDRKTGEEIRYEFVPQLHRTIYVNVEPRGEVAVVHPPSITGYTPKITSRNAHDLKSSIAISRQQPLRFALTNEENRPSSAAGAIRFNEARPGDTIRVKEDAVPFVPLNAVCIDASRMRLTGSGNVPASFRPGDELYLKPFAVAAGANVYPFRFDSSSGIVKEVVSGTPATASTEIGPLSGAKISDRRFTYSMEVPADLCQHHGDQAMSAFALLFVRAAGEGS